MILRLPMQKLFDSKEEIDHILQQQRNKWEGTHVILFMFSGLTVQHQSYVDDMSSQYLFDGAGSGQGSRTQVDSKRLHEYL